MKHLNLFSKYLLFALFIMSSGQIWAYQTDAQDQPLSLTLSDLLGEQALTQTSPSPLAEDTSQEFRPTPAEWIIQTGIHRIMGYVAIGTTLAAGTTAIIAPEIHPPFGWAALGTSLGASILGAIGYWDFMSEVWPHFLFMGLAEIGLALNAFGVFEPGSTAHQITGISSVVSMAVGYLAIRLIF